MNTLIVPCAGKSTRFPGERPKWMLYYPDGKMMLEKALEGIDMRRYGRKIIVIVREHAEKFHADEVLEDIFHFSDGSQGYELLILEDYTFCQAETVYQAIARKNITGGFAVKDSDNFIRLSPCDKDDFVAGLNINGSGKEIGRLGAKSFLILNEQNIITDIIEKKIKSEYISIEMYGFRDSNLFIDAYEHLKMTGNMRHEIYLSHIISYLIGMKKSIYSYVEAVEYEDWGTSLDWDIVLKEKKTVILNIDGTVIKKTEKYGRDNWQLPLVGLGQNMETLKEMYAKGAQIIALTSRDEGSEKLITDFFSGYGITLHQIVFSCNQAQQMLVGSFGCQMPYPAAVAVNLGEDSLLGDYVK